MKMTNFSLDDYTPLPVMYFNYLNIKPPLVNKNWLNKLLDLRGNGTALTKRKRGRPKKGSNSEIALVVTEEFAFVQPTAVDFDNVDELEHDWPEDEENDHNELSQFEEDGHNTTPINTQPEETPSLLGLPKTSVGQKALTVEPVIINSEPVYMCPDCSKTFRALSTLRYHYKLHTGDLLQCETCGSSFVRQYQLKCHQRIHTGALFTCSSCDKGFTTAELLKVHRRSHTGDKPYSCPKCEKKFSSASNLAQHKEIHQTTKKYLCSQCGASFSQRRCLDGHMVIHGEKTHICMVCGKAWARKSDLVEHARTHTGVRPFQCSICHNKFTQASSLKRHAITHQDTTPWACQMCSRSFRSKAYYNRHIKKHLSGT